MIATILGFILGLHLTLLVGLAVYSSDNESSLSGILLFQWCIHVCVIVIFHLLEFFVTAYCNSTVVSATSFVVDQSKVIFFSISQNLQYACLRGLPTGRGLVYSQRVGMMEYLFISTQSSDV